MKKLLFAAAALAVLCCQKTETAEPAAAEKQLAVKEDVTQRLAQIPRTVIDYDRSLLDENEKQAVAKLIEASMNLPEPDEYKNRNGGTESPIRVVQEIYTAGDARRGVQTSAFNLPNDEVVREMKGSKKVLLTNVMEAKFRQSGRPIAMRVLEPSLRDAISFDAYFNHTLFHELSHGLGPGLIPDPAGSGKRVDTRTLLKNLYSAIEECKAAN